MTAIRSRAHLPITGAGIAALLLIGAPVGAGAQNAPAPPLPRPPAPVVRYPRQWWCEVYAQPATDAQLTPEEASRGFFFSQVVERPHARRGEADEVERRCRTSFEVQFGAKWTVVTARAFSAGSADAAVAERFEDMNDAAHRGRTQEFRLPE